VITSLPGPRSMGVAGRAVGGMSAMRCMCTGPTMDSTVSAALSAGTLSAGAMATSAVSAKMEMAVSGKVQVQMHRAAEK
jgi:hypothetical protein